MPLYITKLYSLTDIDAAGEELKALIDGISVAKAGWHIQVNDKNWQNDVRHRCFLDTQDLVTGMVDCLKNNDSALLFGRNADDSEPVNRADVRVSFYVVREPDRGA